MLILCWMYRRRAWVLPSGTDLKSRKGLYSGPFPTWSRAWIFSLFRNSDRPAGTFCWSEVRSTALVGTFHRRRFCLLKTGFFRQVRELKIQRKNPGSALGSALRDEKSFFSSQKLYILHFKLLHCLYVWVNDGGYVLLPVKSCRNSRSYGQSIHVLSTLNRIVETHHHGMQSPRYIIQSWNISQFHLPYQRFWIWYFLKEWRN